MEPVKTRNVNGITLLEQLPDLPFEASDGTQSTLIEYFKGQWGMLFSHPDDFTPICTTELAAVAKLQNAGEFTSRNMKLAGLSCNSVQSHVEWIKDVEQYGGETVNFPIIADVRRTIAAELGMLSPDDVDKKGLPLTVRTLFILDPAVRIRTMITYPASTGRNFIEILRVIDSLQLCDKYKVATPANWTKGKNVCVVSSLSLDEARASFADMLVECLPSGKEYLRFTPDVNEEQQ